nr:unnamed protein product [Naegleria fowleri]
MSATSAAHLNQEKHCTMLVNYDLKPNITKKQLKETLEASPQNVGDEERIEAMKTLLLMQLNGEDFSHMLMTIIQYVLPHPNKILKKLAYYYLETMNRREVGTGRMRPDLLMVCSHVRNDLLHPNEYVRGFALRFLSHVREPDLLEPLITPILQNLEHRTSYVRRCAVTTIFAIYSNSEETNGENLIPDAPELMEEFLKSETEISAMRHAFVMLFHCDQERAVRYLRNMMNTVGQQGDIFQLAILNLLKQMCKQYPSEKATYLKVISSLLESKSSAVVYQCCCTLVALSSSPISVKYAATNFIKLLQNHSDSNVKLICLDRLNELKNKFGVDVMQQEQIVLELLRTLSASTSVNLDNDIRKKILEMAMELISSHTVDAVVSALRRELQKSRSETVEYEKQSEQEYRRHVMRTIHTCVRKFPTQTSNSVLTLIGADQYLSDASGVECAMLVREVVELCTPEFRARVIEKLCENFSTINNARTFRIVLWILGDYCDTVEQIQTAFQTIKSEINDLLQASSDLPVDKHDVDDSVSDTGSLKSTKTTKSTATSAIGKDGTYVTQFADTLSSTDQNAASIANANTLRGLIEDRNFYLVSVVANTLCKLALKLRQVSKDQKEVNRFTAVVMNILTVLIRLGLSSSNVGSSKNQEASKGVAELSHKGIKMDKDTLERINLCLKILASKNEQETSLVDIKDNRSAFTRILTEEKEKEATEREGLKKKKDLRQIQCDSLIVIPQLKGKSFDAFDFEDDPADISRATSNLSASMASDHEKLMSRLSRVTQLTGFSDPVYAEAQVVTHQFDIMLDVLVVNTTNQTFQNLTLEMSTVGDLKLCERPQTYTLAPGARQHITANIKVSSTDNGIIFGNIVYDTPKGESFCIILNDIHINIMDYIFPASCNDIQFRAMWFEFEWENKITVRSLTTDVPLRDYLSFIKTITKMNCLTPDSALDGECEFLSANLYARSSFGEDALANVSLEKLTDGTIEGVVRIRSKTQGIALSLGNIIAEETKKFDEKRLKK